MANGDVTGLVSDVQRFSLHDGPGIRTTVFLKGCPLSCLWCHNPEAIAPCAELALSRDRCNDCGRCIPLCDEKALSLTQGSLALDRARCTACGRCTDACLEDALSLIGQIRTVSQVIEEIERDRSYYEHSGGGLTVSGGEPMAQPKFTAALLREAHGRGIHTCLDTSGFTRSELYLDVLDVVDLFLFDYKATGDSEHRRLTGQPASIVRESFDLLYQHGARIALRCPLVPGLNDRAEHLAAIADLARTHPKLTSVDVMAYHDMARGKAARVGRNDLDLVAANDEQRRSWLDALHALDCDARLG